MAKAWNTLERCSSSWGVSFAQALGARAPLGGNSDVIVFSANIVDEFLSVNVVQDCIPNPEISRSSSSLLPKKAISLSTTISMWDSRMILMS